MKLHGEDSCKKIEEASRKWGATLSVGGDGNEKYNVLYIYQRQGVYFGGFFFICFNEFLAVLKMLGCIIGMGYRCYKVMAHKRNIGACIGACILPSPSFPDKLGAVFNRKKCSVNRVRSIPGSDVTGYIRAILSFLLRSHIYKRN